MSGFISLRSMKKTLGLILLVTLPFLLGSCGKDNAISGKWPDLTLNSDAGKSVHLPDYAGKVTLLVFWATWCGPCQMEIPDLIRLQMTMDTSKFQVVSIIVDDPKGEKAPGFRRSFGINYPILFSESEDIYGYFGGIRALPTSFLVSAEGKFLDKMEGLLPPEFLHNKIMNALQTQTKQ